MGDLAVLNMAENAPPTDPATHLPVHPFFAPNRITTPAADKPPANEARPKKRPRKLTEEDNTGLCVKRGKRAESGKPNESDSLHTDASLQDDHAVNRPNHGDSAPPANGTEANLPTIEQPGAVTNGCVPEPTPTTPAPEASSAKPRKMLQLNPKTGTIGSPPKPKESSTATEGNQDTEKKTVGRRGRTRASRIVRVTYGIDSQTRLKLGELIEAILSGQTHFPPANSKQPPPSNASKQSSEAPRTMTQKASKATHPFFLGQARKPDPAPVAPDPKLKKPNSSPLSARTKHYSVTPCSPRKPHAKTGSKVPMPKFGVRSLGLKFPGTKLPVWPWKGMVHVRDNESETLDPKDKPLPLPCRRSKGNSVKVSPNESVLSLVTSSLGISAIADAVRDINTDEAIPPPPELRLPQKHLESGSKLQSRILSELKTFRPSLSASGKQSAQTSDGSMQAPPQLSRLFDSISSSLSAFDRSQCETANWIQKYAPTSAVEVLQPGQEAFLLRDWLQALMVQSVDTGSGELSKAASSAKVPGAGKKKRRKKLDGFIVSSEDEAHDQVELSDEDEDWAPSGRRGIIRKTVVRSGNLAKGKDGAKIANTLVISGPHGCGKTAAVYAVAKELGFEVFEINPSSRRSGKDVLEKIGDMTRNHHVQQHQPANIADGREPGVEDDTAQDIKSGKQATMNAFFKAKTAVVKPKQTAKAVTKSSPNEVKKEPPKTQRQSLILLEEVDILFEEDKQFWATVTGLIAQAKRPFIMTCNDETLVPLHTLWLHGIFRLSRPPRDLSVDRLILIAANEGHALTRQSVEQLYDSRKRDLRAATMDLQYWCQIAVGDRRGGFDWFYPRWPKGVDLDENGEVVRVVSQDTYRPGMNLLGRDSLVDARVSPHFVEEDVLHQTWEFWGLDLGHWQDSVGLVSWAEGLKPITITPVDRLSTLEAYDGLAEAMSAADVFSLRSFAAFKEEAFDTTQPELPAKARDDYVLGITHLETPVVTHYDTLTTSIASTLRSIGRCSLQLHPESPQKQPAPTLQPLNEDQAIRCLQTSFTSDLPGTTAIGRMDFAFAFDPIASPDTSQPQPAAYLEPSVFDRTLRLITLDVAPYVRGIVGYDSHLQKQRRKLSSLVSEGGRGNQGTKRMRTTRSALSAMEGGSRSTTRGEKWFKADINPYLVAKTAGKGWNGFDCEDLETPGESAGSSVKSSPQTSPDQTPTNTPKKVSLKSRKRKNVIQDEDETDELGC